VILVTMPVATTPVLWLCGPSGVGKTTVAWELFTQLARSGIPTGYVDIDQLGMCYAPPARDDWAPEPASDPGRHRMKIRNLDPVVANFGAAGARCVVVSGVVDAADGVEASLLPHAVLTLCRLRSEPAELRRRLAGRDRPGDLANVAEMLRYADALERGDLFGVCVDTTGRTVAEVVGLVRERTGGWPHLAERPGSPVSEPVDRSQPFGRPTTGPGEILWLCGATAVGKSTVGWAIYEQVRRAGRRASFVDLDQIGFHRPLSADDPGNHRLKAGNLAAIWRTYRDSGSECLVVVGPVEDREAVLIYTTALPAARITLCRLHAGRDQLTDRIIRRGQGFGPDVPGDELRGQPTALLRQLADRAEAQAQALESAAIGELRIDTAGRPAQDVAKELLIRTGWPGPR
jgi:hypothetical protein